MLCDGRVVCGCADPYAKRVLGDAKTSSIEHVWNGPTLAQLRRDMNNAGSKFCGDCALKRPLEPDETPIVRPIEAGRHPRRMSVQLRVWRQPGPDRPGRLVDYSATAHPDMIGTCVPAGVLPDARTFATSSA